MTQQTLANALPVVYAQAGIANLYVNGFHIAVASNTTLTVGSGQCRDSGNDADIILASTATINAAVNGVNGLDAGTFAASTVYGVFVIADPSGFLPTATILSASSSPALPFGYGLSRRIGYATTDASIHFWPMHISGEGSTRLLEYVSAISVQTTGVQTGATPVDLSIAVPAVARIPVVIEYDFTPGAASRTMKLSPSGVTGTNLFTVTGQVTSVHVTGQVVVQELLSSGLPKIDYLVSNADSNAALLVRGFWDFL